MVKEPSFLGWNSKQKHLTEGAFLIVFLGVDHVCIDGEQGAAHHRFERESLFS